MAKIMDTARVKVMTNIKMVKLICCKHQGIKKFENTKAIIDGGEGEEGGMSRVIHTATSTGKVCTWWRTAYIL